MFLKQLKHFEIFTYNANCTVFNGSDERLFCMKFVLENFRLCLLYYIIKSSNIVDKYFNANQYPSLDIARVLPPILSHSPPSHS